MAITAAIVTTLYVFSGCATTGFTEHKKETLPDGTIHEYDEPLPPWMQVASLAQMVLAGGKSDSNWERDHPPNQMP